mmetsp:Transcript_2665/g.3561  ORF Transcript_2665/g.3561 Transcript_2665/m.3561 type:complete len:490 (+) Transcript_2665:208-1677(+)|eukprot:CAMPEP_0198145358 /NCGR_PEP_ID=MMETSP1443-20131203/22936_1 /TAXON_ID=186043 /ORGANISM="Entomoneis sp., Strain CCMP2396" /LENGTH=489 /DNA_ID=CAMNT_0043808975 /DNA_START=113 /DNA_END=1582 /DNA_ORIENTATION=+
MNTLIQFDQNAYDAAFVVIPIVLVAVAALVLIVKKIKARKTNGGSAHVSPPYATNGMLDGIKTFSGADKPLPIGLLDLARKAGNNFQIHLPTTRMTFFSADINVVKEVLNDRDALKSDRYHAFRLMHDGGDDIFTSDGMYWKHSRKGMAPAFSSNHIRRMNEVVVEKTEEFIQSRLNDFVKSGESFDLCDEMMSLTLVIICKAAFEYEMSSNEQEYFVHELELALTEVQKASIPFRWRLGSFIPTVQRARQAGKNVLALATNILETYKKLENPTKGTAIDCIVNNPNYKSDRERASDLVILLFAGHDTTSFSLAFTLLELSLHQDEQDKLRNALRQMPSMDERIKCLELQCVIKEGLRINPTAALASGRYLAKDLIVKGGDDKDMLIPKGSAFGYSPMLVCRNEQYFKDAHLFKPRRWIDPSKEAVAALQPFSIGRRSCVGQNLAQAEMQNVLARLCSDFRFHCKDEGINTYAGTWKPYKSRLTVEKVY